MRSLVNASSAALVAVFSAVTFSASASAFTGAADASPTGTATAVASLEGTATSDAPATPEGAGQQTLVGLVTVNGDVAPPGIRVAVTLEGAEETSCGDFVTGEAATFELILPPACGPGAVAIFQVDTGDQSEARVEITEEQRSFSTTVDFQLSAQALKSLGVSSGPTTDAVTVVPSSPLTGKDLYVVVGVTVLPATVLLILMVWKLGPKNGKSVDDEESSTAERAAGNYRSQIEGMVLVMVVLSVILLGVTDKIGSDGLVSVLAAIVGYTVGKQVGKGQG